MPNEYEPMTNEEKHVEGLVHFEPLCQLCQAEKRKDLLMLEILGLKSHVQTLQTLYEASQKEVRELRDKLKDAGL
jgi:hypothetical protein